MCQLVPSPARNAPPSGPHSRYAQIEALVQSWQPEPHRLGDDACSVSERCDSSDSTESSQEEGDDIDEPSETMNITWIHHSAPRPLPKNKRDRNEVWILDVHDNVGKLVHAYERLKKLPPAHPSRVDPAAWAEWGEEQVAWSDEELAFISDPRIDIVVCIRESDTVQLRGHLPPTKRVIHLPFFLFPSIPCFPPGAPQRPFVALAGGHTASLNGLYGFASEVGTRLEERGADPSIRLSLYGGLALMVKQMGMEAWLRAHRVDVYGSVSDESGAFAGVRAAIVLGIIPVGAKTQIVSAMAKGVPVVGLSAIAASTPLENEWAEEGACDTWDDMADKLVELNAAEASPSSSFQKVVTALEAFHDRIVAPAEESICHACFGFKQ